MVRSGAAGGTTTGRARPNRTIKDPRSNAAAAYIASSSVGNPVNGSVPAAELAAPVLAAARRGATALLPAPTVPGAAAAPPAAPAMPTGAATGAATGAPAAFGAATGGAAAGEKVSTVTGALPPSPPPLVLPLPPPLVLPLPPPVAFPVVLLPVVLLPVVLLPVVLLPVVLLPVVLLPVVLLPVVLLPVVLPPVVLLPVVLLPVVLLPVVLLPVVLPPLVEPPPPPVLVPAQVCESTRTASSSGMLPLKVAVASFTIVAPLVNTLMPLPFWMTSQPVTVPLNDPEIEVMLGSVDFGDASRAGTTKCQSVSAPEYPEQSPLRNSVALWPFWLSLSAAVVAAYAELEVTAVAMSQIAPVAAVIPTSRLVLVRMGPPGPYSPRAARGQEIAASSFRDPYRAPAHRTSHFAQLYSP